MMGHVDDGDDLFRKVSCAVFTHRNAASVPQQVRTPFVNRSPLFE